MPEIKCPDCGSINWRLSVSNGMLIFSCEYSHYLAGCYIEKEFSLDDTLQSVIDYLENENKNLRCGKELPVDVEGE